MSLTPLDIQHKEFPVKIKGYASPVLCFIIQNITVALWEYHFSYELIIMNAAITFIGMWMLIKKNIIKR